MAAQVDDGLDYRRLPGDGSPPETAHTLPFGFRLARRMRRSIGERDWHSLHIRARGPIFLVCPHVKHRQLRSGSLRFVRRLRSYYGEVRLASSIVFGRNKFYRVGIRTYNKPRLLKRSRLLGTRRTR